MLAALTIMLPVGLGGAISPMLLTEQTVLLGTGGRGAAKSFAVGAILTLVVIVFALVFFGRAISLPTEPDLSAGTDVLIGVGLLFVVAAFDGVTRFRPDRHRTRSTAATGAGEGKDKPAARSQAALSFGVFSMATNFTTLALVVVAAKQIATAHVGTAGRLFLIAVLVALCSLPVWAPLLLTRLAPRTGERFLDALQRLITDHGRTLIVVLLAGAGLFLVGRGAIHLL